MREIVESDGIVSGARISPRASDSVAPPGDLNIYNDYSHKDCSQSSKY